MAASCVTDSEVSIPQTAAGLALYRVFYVTVSHLSVGVEGGTQLSRTAGTQYHVERRLIRAQLTFSCLHVYITDHIGRIPVPPTVASQYIHLLNNEA